MDRPELTESSMITTGSAGSSLPSISLREPWGLRSLRTSTPR